MSSSSVDNALLPKACDFIWLIPNVAFQKALELVGIPTYKAASKSVQNDFKYQLDVMIQDLQVDTFSDNVKGPV